MWAAQRSNPHKLASDSSADAAEHRADSRRLLATAMHLHAAIQAAPVQPASASVHGPPWLASMLIERSKVKKRTPLLLESSHARRTGYFFNNGTAYSKFSCNPDDMQRAFHNACKESVIRIEYGCPYICDGGLA